MDSYHWIDGLIMAVCGFAAFGLGVFLECVIEEIKERCNHDKRRCK